jgi:hypothetical protein
MASAITAMLMLGGLLSACGPGGLRPGVPGCGDGGGDNPIGGVIPSPACSSGPMDTSTPMPVPEADARRAANAFTRSSPEWEIGRSSVLSVYELRSPDAYVVVDGLNGRVLEWFGRQPDVTPPYGGVPSWSPAPSPVASAKPEAISASFAQSTARSWLADRGIATRDNGTATPFAIAGETGWDLQLSDTDGSGVQAVVRDGRVVGILRADAAYTFRLPHISRDAAIKLALAESYQRYHQVESLTSAEFDGYLGGDGQTLDWTVGTGVPKPDPSYGTVWESGLVAGVDAGTGTLTVLKATP